MARKFLLCFHDFSVWNYQKVTPILETLKDLAGAPFSILVIPDTETAPSDTVRDFRATLAQLKSEGFELAQPPLPSTLRGEKIKYVGVWMPEGGFVLVGAREKALRNLARSALTGLTHGWHVSGDEGGIFITTDNGTIISHPVAGQEGGQWRDPGADYYWEKRMFEGFPVYVVIPKRTAVVERRVLVATSAFLNGMALILAAILVGLVIAHLRHETIDVFCSYVGRI